ncbi:MAG: MFS transporter [Proteobacteria bacterium]|nr:MAG: MFS transporter [Pseudomonadota bacterium]
MSSDQQTRWWPVFAAFVAGCLGAAQIGKVAASLSIVIDDLQLSLLEGGLVVSLFTLTTALTGSLFGVLGDRYGHRRLAIAGLLISAVGAVLGSFSHSVTVLLATRIVEGVGFTLAVVCLPPLVSQAASDRDRPVAMGLWGAFMPAGIGVMMVVSPWLVAGFGWRGLWNSVALALVVWTVLLATADRAGPRRDRGAMRSLKSMTAAVFRPGPMVLFGCFGCYSAMYVPLTAFFTTLLVTQKSVPADVAAWVGAPVVAANIIGNLAAGWLVRHGVAPHRLLRIAFVTMGVCASIVFVSLSPVWVKVVAGILFSAFGGLIPGTLFILAPGFASHPSQIAALSGLLLQGAGIGQTLGPLVVSASVDYFSGWGHASWNMGLATAGGLLLASKLARRSDAV